MAYTNQYLDFDGKVQRSHEALDAFEKMLEDGKVPNPALLDTAFDYAENLDEPENREDRIPYNYLWARLCFHDGEDDEARKLLNHNLRENPDHHASLELLKKCCKNGDPSRSLRSSIRILLTESSNRPGKATSILGRAMRLGQILIDYELSEKPTLSEEFDRSYYMLGAVHERLGHFEEAKHCFEQALAYEPDHEPSARGIKFCNDM